MSTIKRDVKQESRQTKILNNIKQINKSYAQILHRYSDVKQSMKYLYF